MRIGPIAARCISVAILASLPVKQNRAELRYIETRDLRIVNFDPTGAYLLPYATQCFLNAIAAQHALFDYTPDGKVAVLLQDFSDRGNATLLTTPRNRIFLDIASTTLAAECTIAGRNTSRG